MLNTSTHFKQGRTLLLQRGLEQIGIQILGTAIWEPIVCGLPVWIGSGNLLQKSYFGCFCCIGNTNQFLTSQIGNYSSIGNDCRFGMVKHFIKLLSSSNVFYDGTRTSFPEFTYKHPEPIKQHFGDEESHVRIGHDVSIGNHVLATTDLTIGSGSIIEPGSILTKDVPPYSIVRGVNHIVGQRFSDEIISDLLDIEWWNYNLPQAKIQGISFPSDVKDFLAWFHSTDFAILPKVSAQRFLIKPQGLEMHTATEVDPQFKFDWDTDTPTSAQAKSQMPTDEDRCTDKIMNPDE